MYDRRGIQFAYPFELGSNGQPARVDEVRHVNDMIEQILFTGVGERVNLPTFGCAIGSYVFEPASAELLAALRALVQSALQTWLGDVIAVADISVVFEQEQLRITIGYTLLSTRKSIRTEFVR